MTDLLTDNGYKWPGMYSQPFDHQRVTAAFLVRNKRAFCLNDIGSGKTMSALWASDFLMKAGAIRKVLIVTPLSTLISVWSDEIFLNMRGRTSVVLHGTKEKRLKLLQEDHDFYLVNHDGLQIIYHGLQARGDIDLVIIDESAEFRNARTDKWRAANLFTGHHTKKGLWCMTGSPMPGSPMDVWAQARLVNPSLVPKYFTRFRDDMMIKFGMYKWVPIKGWQDKCFSMLQPSIRFSRDECIDLLPCTTQTHQVSMSAEQTRAYREMMQTLRSELKTGTINAVNEGSKRIKLMQLAAGAVYSGDEVVHHLDCTPKITALTDAVAAAGNKAIVFVSFRHSIPLLKKHFEKIGLSVDVVYGDISMSKRSRIFSDFQRGSLQVIVAHPGTASHGLNLTASHTIIWYSPVDSYRIYEQANGRITRPGQTRKQTIVHLVCAEIERKIYARLRKKEGMQNLLLELLEEKIKKT